MEALLNNPDVRAALRLAWRQSQPGPSGGHEEGGFIVQGPAGKLQVIRWPRGAGNTIEVPNALLYFVTPSGSVVELGETERILTGA